MDKMTYYGYVDMSSNLVERNCFRLISKFYNDYFLKSLVFFEFKSQSFYLKISDIYSITKFTIRIKN